MANILSQAEVDALLGAMETGDPASGGKPGSRDSRQVMPYDFRRPNRAMFKDQLRFFQSVHEEFARRYASSLSGYLRSLVEIDLLSIDHLAYGEFVQSLPKSTNLFTFDAEPLEGRGILEINPSLILVMIDRLFGGSGTPAEVDRELTDIESAVTTKLVQRGLQMLQEAWSGVTDLKLEIAEHATNPHSLQLMPESESVVMLTFELRVRESSGTFSLCYPYLTTEPVLTGLSRSRANRSRTGRSRGGTPQWMRERVEESALQVVAELGTTAMTVAEFLNLREGDVLRLDRRLDQAADLKIGGSIKGSARPGLQGSHRVVRIERMERQGGRNDES